MKKKTIVFVMLLAISIPLIVLILKNNSKKNNFFKEEETENSKHSEAMDALQFFCSARAYPNKDIPADAYAKAITWYKQNVNFNQRTQSTTSWASLGPINMGGRTLAIALDPIDTATIWLGSAGGGLWKSTSGGIGTYAWNYIPLGFPVASISSIAINPTNHLEMYVGSGEVYSYGTFSQGIVDVRPTRGSYGMGLFKSADGGNTWTQSINWTYQQNRGIWDIVINPLNPNTVYAATTEGVYKTLDAGASWSLVLNVNMAMDLEMHEIDTNIVLCGVGNNGSPTHGVYRTTNSGANWSAVTNGLPSNTSYQGRVTFTKYKNNNDIMLAHICDVYNSIGVYKSTDKGQTWVQQTGQNLSSYQGWYCKGLVIQPSNINNVLAGGVYLFGASDGGVSFNQNNGNYHSDIHDILINPIDENKIYVITDGGLFRSNDWGNTFYDCNGNYVTTQHYIGSISSTDTTVLLSGLQDNYTIKYFGGNNWSPVIGGDGSYNAIDPTNDQIQYGSYQYLNVFQDINQGNGGFNTPILTYNASSIAPNYAAFLAPFILCPSNTQYIYAGGIGLQLSTDGGSSWNAIGNTPVNDSAYIMTIASSFTNTDSIYFATAPNHNSQIKVFSSVDGGSTLQDISLGLPNRYPRRIAVNPKNSQEVYIVFSGFGTGHVFKSINGGNNWADISTTLPDLPFECITVDPLDPNFIYAGCDFGIFVSSDKGNSWTSYNTGLPDVSMTFDLLVSPSDRYLYSFTHGHGIFKRSLSDLNVEIKKNINKNVSINVFPNPASNQIHVNLSGLEHATYTFYLYDMQGKQLKNYPLTNADNLVTISDLAASSYLISIRKNGLPFYYKALVKN
jgi:photosystem II stability/assembly factor-like uncharacterized protein